MHTTQAGGSDPAEAPLVTPRSTRHTNTHSGAHSGHAPAESDQGGAFPGEGVDYVYGKYETNTNKNSD